MPRLLQMPPAQLQCWLYLLYQQETEEVSTTSLMERWQSPVECACLENRKGRETFGGSNPSLSAT